MAIGGPARPFQRRRLRRGSCPSEDAAGSVVGGSMAGDFGPPIYSRRGRGGIVAGDKPTRTMALGGPARPFERRPVRRGSCPSGDAGGSMTQPVAAVIRRQFDLSIVGKVRLRKLDMVLCSGVRMVATAHLGNTMFTYVQTDRPSHHFVRQKRLFLNNAYYFFYT